MGLFMAAYGLVDVGNYSLSVARTMTLPRKVAEEITLAAVLCPLMVADISTPFHSQIFATDASEQRGAVLSAPVDPTVNEALYKSFKTKGSYTRLQSPDKFLSQRLWITEPEEDQEEKLGSRVDRPLAYRFDWAFPRENHINILEMKVVHRLIKGLVLEKMKARVVSFIDSNVCRCSLGKGRSSSRALTSVLRRINALLIAGGLWLVTPFMPTRLNCADDPTRLAKLRPPLPPLGVHQLSREMIFECACLPRQGGGHLDGSESLYV